jgi:hypothetical protein
VILGLNERMDSLRLIVPGAVRVLEAAMAEAGATQAK